MSQEYADFIARKLQTERGQGLPYTYPMPQLFDFQQHLVEWALDNACSAIFADCGLGKTPIQLALSLIHI